ncbi:MAG: anaerobic ribonucleoside-triphosphate reductase activating protein [Pseudomonas sp.]|jgi:anaerobic ribonucleoside-triphosphate reductase activating protein|nr:anaerobic ribonucleoside-triphosphate reductase activating protein [Pseudomonas sp.]
MAPPNIKHQASALRIGGLQPLTTLDYPNHLACVVFCQGCAWRCRYCHNPELIPRNPEPGVPWSAVLELLDRRQGMLQAVVFSGGEATLQPALPAAMRSVRERGFKVGLHTAGIRPAALSRVLPYCDWVGMDVKALEEDCQLITGVRGSGRANWASLERVLASGVEYECRTTVHWGLFDGPRVMRLGERLAEAGVKRFVVQLARAGRVLDQALGDVHRPDGFERVWEDLGQLFEWFEVREG